MSGIAQDIASLLEAGGGGVGRFAETLEPQWIEEALGATGTASIRRRKLPAEQAVWLTIGMGLFADRSIRDVVDHLGLVIGGKTVPSAIVQARYRLGEEPLKWLFHRVADAWSNQDAVGYEGLTVCAIDGTCVRVQDTDENFEHFGKPGGRSGSNDAGYPQLRLAVLLNVETRLAMDASFGAYATSEHTLAQALLPKIPDKSVVILDKGFTSYSLFCDLQGDGNKERHFLIRMRKGIRLHEGQVLEDGTQLAKLKPTRTLTRLREGLPPALTVRIIEYQFQGHPPQQLVTTLLDPNKYKAADLIELYHARWEIELAFDEVKTHMLERKEALRSLKPEGVHQEMWAVLLAYNLVRREMTIAATTHQRPIHQMSFRSSLLWIRNFWLTAWRTSTTNIPRHLGQFVSTLDVLFLPPRRDRAYPRHVKIKMTSYPRNRGKRHIGPSEPENDEKICLN
jgi:hypothetical protein